MSYHVVWFFFLAVQFNETFFHFVLDNIEDPPVDDSSDQVPDGLIGMLLAFNLHFKGKPLKTDAFENYIERVILHGGSFHFSESGYSG